MRPVQAASGPCLHTESIEVKSAFSWTRGSISIDKGVGVTTDKDPWFQSVKVMAIASPQAPFFFCRSLDHVNCDETSNDMDMIYILAYTGT